MNYNQNIYDIFKYRKENTFYEKTLDELFLESYEIDNQLNSEIIEIKSTFYMEDLVLEAMMYDDFNEENIGILLEEMQEERKKTISESLRNTWNKIVEWVKGIKKALINFFKSCKKALKDAIDALMGKKKVSSNGGKVDPTVVKGTDIKNDPDVIDVTPKTDNKKPKPGQKLLGGGNNEPNEPEESEPNEPKQLGGTTVDVKLKEKFKNSKLSVKIPQFNDIEEAGRNSVIKIASLARPELYTKNKEEILKSVGVESVDGARSLIKSYFYKDKKNIKIPVNKLDPIKLQNIINNSEKYVSFVNEIESRCINSFNNTINKYENIGKPEYMDYIRFGMTLINVMVRETIQQIRFQISSYEKIILKVIKKSK